MVSPKELFRIISEDLKSEKKFTFSMLGEGMGQVRDNNTEQVFLLNNNIKEAWALTSSDRCLENWNLSDIDLSSILFLPDLPRELAVNFRAEYNFEISEFLNGVASVSWMIQPDCRFFADEDCFGMDDDREIILVAFIDQCANILVPFQPMDYILQIQYRSLAENMIIRPKDVNYLCLNPELSIPLSENKNLDVHKAILRKKIYGLMFLLASMARENFNYEENDLHEGIFTAINPNQEQFLFIGLRIKEVEGHNDIYDIHVMTGLFKDNTMEALYSEMEGGNITDIESIMLNSENIELILEDFIRSAEMLYSGSIHNNPES